MIEAFLLDLDRMLINNDLWHYQARQEILLRYSVEIDKDFYKQRMSGKLNPDIVKDLLPDFSPKESQDFIEEKEANYRPLAKDVQLIEGLENLLAWAKLRTTSLALVTNMPRKNTQLTLKLLGLETTFATVVLGKNVAVDKPEPTPYRIALEPL